jgi:hypothetical protein
MNATTSPANLPESDAAFLEAVHQAHDHRYRNMTIKPPYPTLEDARAREEQRRKEAPVIGRILAEAQAQKLI